MAETKKGSPPINWNYVLIGGFTLGGIVLLTKLLQNIGGGITPEEHDIAVRILEDWQNEFDLVHELIDKIYSEGRTPTDDEMAIISSFQDQMKLKEYNISHHDPTVIEQLKDFVNSVAQSLGLIVGVLILGWITIKIIIPLLRNRFPPKPPNYPCPVCDFVGTTKSALNLHIRNQHTIQTANLDQAQYAFNQLPSAVQYYIADVAGSTSYATMDWITANRDIIIAIGVAAGIAIACLVLPPVAPGVVAALRVAMGLAFA
jgi:hypothetical protein